MEKKFLRKGPKKPPISVFQADEVFVKKILSRNSTDGNCSFRLQNFRAPAEVPFKWESQPGKSKDPPKGDLFRPPYADPLPSPEASAPHVPAPSPRAPMPPVSEGEVNNVLLWKKLIERGHKTVKKVRPKVARAASITVARAASISVARGLVMFDGILPKSNYYSDYFNSSIVSSSSQPSSSSSNNSLAFDGTSKVQNFVRGALNGPFRS